MRSTCRGGRRRSKADDDDDAPARRRPGKKKKSSKSNDGSSTILIGAGVGAAVIVVITGLVRIGDQFAFPRERQIGPAESAASNFAGRWMLQTDCGPRPKLATDELIPIREIQQLPPPLFDAYEKIIGHADSSPIL